MEMEKSNSNARTIQWSTILAIFEKFSEIVINFVFSMVVIRVLTIKDYAVITSFAGYMTFVSFINISPEVILYKSYSQIKKEQISEKITVYLFFDLLKALLISVVYICIGYTLSNKFCSYSYFFIAVMNGVILFAEQFYCIGRILLELNSKQFKLTIITLIARISRLLLIFLLLLKNDIQIYCLIMAMVATVEDGIVFCLAIRETKYFFSLNLRRSIKELKNIFFDFVFLNHSSGVLNSIIYASDTMFLSWFCKEAVVGRYGIVLGAINYVTVLFQVIQKQVSIALGKSSSLEENVKSTEKFCSLCLIIAIPIVFIFGVFGKFLLKIYSGDSFSDEMYWYGLFILLGTSTFNIVRPMLMFILYKGNLLKYLLKVLLPVFVLTLSLYFFSSKYIGGIGIAFCNIIIYACWSFLTIIMYRNIRMIIPS